MCTLCVLMAKGSARTKVVTTSYQGDRYDPPETVDHLEENQGRHMLHNNPSLSQQHQLQLLRLIMLSQY